MIAEVLREIGLLFVTFVPLDAVFEKKALTPFWFWTGLSTGLGLVGVGVVLERIRGKLRK